MRVIQLLGVAVFIGIVVYGISKSPADVKMSDSQKAAVAAWNKVLAQRCALGQPESDVNRLMLGKYRDRGVVNHGGTGAYTVVFLIDDFHEIAFAFDKLSKMSMLPAVTAKKHWLKFPDDNIIELDVPE